MKKAYWISMILAAGLVSIGCSQTIATKDKNESERQEPLRYGKILGIYPTQEVVKVEMEHVGGFPAPPPHTSYKISILLNRPAMVTKIGRDDVMSWSCDFVLPDSDRDLLIRNLEEAYLTTETKQDVAVDQGTEYLRVYSAAGRLGEHPFEGGEFNHATVPFIKSAPLRLQLSEIFDRFTCVHVY